MIGLPIFIEEFLLTMLIVFVISVFYRFLINQNEIRELKASLKEKQTKLKELQKTNQQEANKVLNEILLLNNKQFRIMLKPMLLTLIVVGLSLSYFGQLFPGTVVKLPFELPFFGSDFGWLMWYIIISIPLGQLFRKLLGAEI
ncbi:MAG: EMC3/TMCO1 family protein [Candidatus Aenigmatarchaeota archaeon]